MENPRGKVRHSQFAASMSACFNERARNILTADIGNRFVSGRGFSRAAPVGFRLWALAPEIFPAGAKALTSALYSARLKAFSERSRRVVP